MARRHVYRTFTTWTGNLGPGTVDYAGYERALETVALGRPAILGSSDPSFRGDAQRWNPELLLVASLSQCHLLWYLSLCAMSGVVVVDYRDDAVGEMIETPDGGGHIESVTLRPHVVVSAEHMRESARQLHGAANERCFIASSVNFTVRHEPSIMVASAPLDPTGTDR